MFPSLIEASNYSLDEIFWSNPNDLSYLASLLERSVFDKLNVKYPSLVSLPDNKVKHTTDLIIIDLKNYFRKLSLEQIDNISDKVLAEAQNAVVESLYYLLKQGIKAKQSQAEAEGLKVLTSSEVSLVYAGRKIIVRFLPLKFNTVERMKNILGEKQKAVQYYIFKLHKKVEALLSKTEEEIRNLYQKISLNYYQNKAIKLVVPILDFLAKSVVQINLLLKKGITVLVPEKIQRIELELTELERETEEIEEMLASFSERDLKELSMLTYGVKNPKEILKILEDYQNFKSAEAILNEKVVKSAETEEHPENERRKRNLQAFLIKKKLARVLDKLEQDVAAMDGKAVARQIEIQPELKIKFIDKSKLKNKFLVKKEKIPTHKMTVTI